LKEDTIYRNSKERTIIYSVAKQHLAIHEVNNLAVREAAPALCFS
jgi:hypothetical protein